MTRTCLTCVNKEKPSGDHWDRAGGDFYVCTAKVIFPEFVAQSANDRRVARTLNLNLFRDPAPTAPGLAARSCPLWSGAEV